MYSINFTENGTTFCLSLHYNGANSYLFVNGTEIIKLKAKDSEMVGTSFCLGKGLDQMNMFMILVLIMMLLQLMIY